MWCPTLVDRQLSGRIWVCQPSVNDGQEDVVGVWCLRAGRPQKPVGVNSGRLALGRLRKKNDSSELLTITIKAVWRSLALCTWRTFEFTSRSVSPRTRETVWERMFEEGGGKVFESRCQRVVGVTRSTEVKSWTALVILFFCQPGIWSIHQFAFATPWHRDLCPRPGHGGLLLSWLLSCYPLCEILVSTLPWRPTEKQCQRLTEARPWRPVTGSWSVDTAAPQACYQDPGRYLISAIRALISDSSLAADHRPLGLRPRPCLQWSSLSCGLFSVFL